MDDAERAYFWKIEAFGDHLGADNNVVFAGMNLFVDFVELLAGFGVGVEAGNLGVWEEFLEFLLDELGAEALVMDSGIATFWTRGRNREAAATSMATHLVFICVQNQW